MVFSFIMLYTLLRLPTAEPDFWVMLSNFFSISWSTRNCQKNSLNDLLQRGRGSVGWPYHFVSEGNNHGHELFQRQKSFLIASPMTSVEPAEGSSTFPRRPSKIIKRNPPPPSNLLTVTTGTKGATHSLVAQQFSNSNVSNSGQSPHDNANPGSCDFVAIDIPNEAKYYKSEAERRKAEAENAERHKKRWLIFCVALDKSIMYAVTGWLFSNATLGSRK